MALRVKGAEPASAASGSQDAGSRNRTHIIVGYTVHGVNSSMLIVMTSVKKTFTQSVYMCIIQRVL